VAVDVSHAQQGCSDARDSGRVLIVEDDPGTARSLSSILRRAGYLPTVCYNGTEALRSAGHLAPAAAMVDIHLPDLSGLVITQKLRAQLGPRVPIIVVSGDTSMETLNSLAHVGATYFLSKPTAPAVLLQMLNDCIVDASRKAS
jgi:DNA-binding response OmpR family regulator